MSTDQIVFEEKNEQFGFTQLPNVVLTSTVLNPTEVRIYAILRRYASMPNGAMPSAPTICAEANISKATYNRAIKTFIKSDKNPKPEVPLITAIHRDGMSNVFKIHQINDYLIEKLKPVVSLSKSERKSLKSQKRQQKKHPSQNETTNPSQNETTNPSQNETTNPSQNETQVILNNNNIDNNKEQEQKDVVVFFKNEIKNIFKKSVTDSAAKQMITTFQAHGKTIEESLTLLTEINQEFSNAFDQMPTVKEAYSLLVSLLGNDCEFPEVLKSTIAYFQRKNQPIYNPVGSLLNAIEKGLISQEEKEDAKQRGSVEAEKKIEATKKLLEMYQ